MPQTHLNPLTEKKPFGLINISQEKHLATAVTALVRIAKLEECTEIERGPNNTHHDVCANQIAEDALAEINIKVKKNESSKKYKYYKRN
jgi:hypothetical protein